MKYRKENFVIDNKSCIGYITDAAKYLLIQPVDEHDIEALDKEVAEIQKNTEKQFSLIAFKIEDWNNELSPWEAPPAFGNKSFGSGAKGTLEFIESKLIPEVKERYDFADDVQVILGGYSLAGLFSLWSAYKSNTFSGIAAASPPVVVRLFPVSFLLISGFFWSMAEQRNHLRPRLMRQQMRLLFLAKG